MTIVKVKSKAELEREGVKAAFLELRGSPYKAIAQDHAAWTDLKKVASIAEIEERWRAGLTATGYLQCSTIWELGRKWNDLGPLVKRSRPADAVYFDCEACGVQCDTASGFVKFCRVELCAECFRKAMDVEAKVPVPRGLRLGSPQLAEYHCACDLAVSLWARASTGAKS